jgi:hypothetical protein
MVLSKTPTPQDDEVSALIDNLYDERMMLQFEYMDLRKKGKKDKEFLAEMYENILAINEDFESIIKAHTLYLRFKKATGHGKPSHSDEMLQKIKELRTNVGQIVSAIPSNYKHNGVQD